MAKSTKARGLTMKGLATAAPVVAAPAPVVEAPATAEEEVPDVVPAVDIDPGDGEADEDGGHGESDSGLPGVRRSPGRERKGRG